MARHSSGMAVGLDARKMTHALARGLRRSLSVKPLDDIMLVDSARSKASSAMLAKRKAKTFNQFDFKLFEKFFALKEYRKGKN